MKKFAKTLVLIVLSMCIAFTIAACGNDASDFSYGEEYETNGITLGLYEELDLLPIDGNAEGITLASADESIVSVNGNRLIAETEGVTTVTATRKKKSKTLTVRVYDDGAKLSIGTDQDVVYIDNETDLGFHVTYKQKNYAYGADYVLTIADEYKSIAEVRNGKIYGKGEGTIKVKVRLEDYKGAEVRGEFTLKVCPASFVDVASNTLSVYNAKDSKLATAKIEQTVHYNAKKLTDAEVVYEVTDGADKITVDEEGNVTAKAEGTATVKVKYASDESVFAEVTVNVNPNYIGTQFFKSGLGGQDYTEYTGTEEIGGRKEGIFEYTQGSGSDWDSRMSYAEAGESIVNNARKGYKYFGYDLYLGGSQLYIGLDHADCQWFHAGSYLRTDYMQVIDCETGAITNRLERNKWIRIVYNLDYYLNNSSYVAFAETGFFYAQSGAVGSHSYIDNVRWYLDDEYYDHDAEGNVKYTLNDDGTISATNNEWTFDSTEVTYNGEVINTESTYAPAGEEIDGVSGAWKFAPVTVTRPNKDDSSKTKVVFGSWENQLKLVSATAYKNGSTGDIGYNVNGMRNLTEGIAKKVGAPVNDSVESKYKFVTFDLYVENGDSFSINLNHVNIGGNINLGTTMAEEGYVDGGTDLSTKASYLKAWKKGSDKLAYYIEKGNWYTVSLAYFDNYDANAWSCNILFAGNGGNVYYINDVKYHKTMDGVAPTEYAGLKPVSGLNMLDNTKASGQTLSWVYADEVAEKGDAFEGALKFKTNAVSNSWDTSRLGFDGVAVNGAFFKDGMKYIVTDVYFDENVASLGAFTWATFGSSWSGAQYTKGLTLGATTEMYLYENGARVKSNVEANKWYKLVIPVDYRAMPQWCVASVEIKAKDASVAAYTYFNNITYTKDIPYECKDLVITTKPETIAWKDMAGDNAADTKSYDLSYIATPGLEVEWSSNNEDVATVENGTITFKRGKWGQSVTITATATVSEDVTVTDSFTVTLTNNVTEFSPSSSMTLAYGNDDEADTIFASTSATNAAWNNTFAFTAIVNGSKPVDAYRGTGNKFAVMDVKFDSNVKQFLITMWLNTGSSATYQKYVTIGSAVDNDTYFYDANGARVKGNIEADTWYKLYIPTDYTNANTNWAQAYLGMNAKTEAKAEMQIKNLTYVKAIEGMHDLKITGVPSGDVQLETTQEVQLGVETDVEYTWSANNDDVATIDQNGKLTIVGSGKVTVTVTPTDTKYAGLTSSVTISVISEWDEPTAWHLDTTAAEWQGNTGDQFAKSWKVTGKNLVIASANSAAAKADYIILDLYLSKSKGFTYHSNMYTANNVARAWVWGNSVPGQLVIKQKDWVTTVKATDKYVKVYDMNGNAVSTVTNGVWYKVILPFNKENKDINWGESQLMLEADSNGDKEVYFRNVSYGSTLPSGLYERINVTGVPTNDVYLSSGTCQLGVDTDLEVNWTSSSDEIATVDSTGLVTFHTTGSVNITATPTDEKRASLARTVTLNIVSYVARITNAPASLDWADLATGRTFTLETEASPELTLAWSVDETDYASVNNGVVTFNEAAIGNDVTVTLNGKIGDNVVVSDSVTFNLTHEMKHFSANTGLSSLAYGIGDEIDVVLATATKTDSNDSWNSSVLFTDLIEAGTVNRPSVAYMNAGYKWVSVELMFDENLQFIRPNLDWQGDAATYYRVVIYPNTTLDDNVYAFNMDGVRVGTITANTWYKFFFPVELADKDKFHTENLCVWANDGTTTVLKLRNFACSTARTGVYDILTVTGGTNSSVIFTEGGTNTVQLGIANGFDVYNGYTWTVDDNEVATVADGLVTFLKTGSVNVTVTPVNTAYASLATTVTLKAVTAEDKQNEWHFASTATTWVEEGEFANTWKFTGSDLIIGGKDSSYTGDSGSVATANYVTLEMYFSKATGFNYFSNMYTNGSDKKGKVAYAWMWGNTTRKAVTIYLSDWSTVAGTTNNFVRFYEMDGSASTKLETGKWYKVVLPQNIESNSITWGDARMKIDGSEREVYYRNVSYGDTIPAGWIIE